MRKEITKDSRWMAPYSKYPNKEFYKEFKKVFPKYKDIEESRFVNILDTFNEVIVEEITLNREGIELPEKMGTITMLSCDRPKKSPINYNIYKKTGQKTGYLNFDTNNKLVKIFFSNSNLKLRFAMKDCWDFIPSRFMKKEVSKAFKKNYRMYYHIKNKIKLNNIRK